ncbi:methyltransferase domain-containing protein [Bacillus mesophilum]|uniref:Methyltransferase domain-containing protein n=2 Tax=Bacillus mesophilum TaxID=1071718 RepID=A0A7V7RJ89_9BACI|nr:methyltransferase domain-containing protein [Bacillus mesophilum]
MYKTGLGSNESEGFINWARKYDANSFTAEGTKRTERIISWIEKQIDSVENLTMLDVGAASGIFSIPFSKRGAKVTSLEPSSLLSSMLYRNAEDHGVMINIVNQSFEDFNPADHQDYDFVFASMCPAMSDWNAIKKGLNLANKYFYVSLSAGPNENLLVEELLSELKIEAPNILTSDMFYILQLLYLNNYTYQSLIERHQKTVEMTLEEVIDSLEVWFSNYNISLTEVQKADSIDYLRNKYGQKVAVTTGGKFGKVLVHL